MEYIKEIKLLYNRVPTAAVVSDHNNEVLYFDTAKKDLINFYEKEHRLQLSRLDAAKSGKRLNSGQSAKFGTKQNRFIPCVKDSLYSDNYNTANEKDPTTPQQSKNSSRKKSTSLSKSSVPRSHQ
jgi:hypothetical protein